MIAVRGDLTALVLDSQVKVAGKIPSPEAIAGCLKYNTCFF